MKIGIYKQPMPEHYIMSTDADIIISVKNSQKYLVQNIINILSEHFDITIEDDRLIKKDKTL